MGLSYITGSYVKLKARVLYVFNPTALEKAKTLESFGLSECNRVKTGSILKTNKVKNQSS